MRRNGLWERCRLHAFENISRKTLRGSTSASHIATKVVWKRRKFVCHLRRRSFAATSALIFFASMFFLAPRSRQQATRRLPTEALYDCYDCFNESAHFSRLHLPASGDQNHTVGLTSRVHGPVRRSVGLSWFAYENVCMNGEDSIKYFETDDGGYLANVSRLGLSGVTQPYRSAPFNKGRVGATDLYYLRGTTLILGCWRVKRGRLQPSHFLFGYGKLYALINDGLNRLDVNHVVFFQCPDVFQGNRGDFFHSIFEIVFGSGTRNGWFNSSTRIYTVGFEERTPTLCIERGMMDHSTGRYLGQNHDKTILSWKGDLLRFLQSESKSRKLEEREYPSPRNGILSRRKGFHHDCFSTLRIGIFQRSEGSNLRLFTNLPDVIALAETFSASVEVFTVGSSTSFLKALITFNSFDIFVVPHGSHMTNGLLIDSRRRRVNVIEVVATCVNSDFMQNLKPFVASYEISTGHTVSESSVQQYISECETYEVRGCSFTPRCGFPQVRRALQDVLVNITVLRRALQRAVALSCGKPHHLLLFG
mmetsp:Transcript_11798/g.50849  ORF Transcript_11798/g.50849 Transcript_11798/m.50849 type:complete len:534 (-) Transcript_11798:100-1701(-)